MMRNIGFVIAILLIAISIKVNGNDGDVKGRLLSPNEGCGLTKVSNKRIVGGSVAPVGAYPWMALLGRENVFFNQIKLSFFCGGSLITSKHVLTAAHCCAAQTRLKFVRLGEHDLRTTDDGPHVDIPVARSVINEHFDPSVKVHDIAIIHLERDVEFSDRIRPICVPTEEPILSRDFAGNNPFVAGWGDVDSREHSSQVLKQLQVPVIDIERCKDLAKEIGVTIADIQITDSKICAGIYGGENFWDGDSGGPLMLPIHQNGTFPFYQIGIVSYSYRFATENVPGIYTKVQYYADWIKKHIDA